MAKKRAQASRPASDLFPGYPPELESVARFLKGYLYDGPIAAGKTGITHRLKEERTGQLYCLKTIRPDVKDQMARDRVVDTLKKECAILEPLSHNCLPRIFLHRKVQDTYFYVCTYHPGMTFHKFRESGSSLNQLESVFVIRSLMDVLRCVHEKGRIHCDLHSGNVLISKSVLQHGIMVIDFGSGHRYSDSSPETELRGNIYLKPEDMRARQNLLIPRHDRGLEESDFKGLGELLIEMREVFFRDANPLVRDAYMDFAKALYDRRKPSWDETERAFAAVVDPLRIVTNNSDLFMSRAGMPQDIPLPVLINVPVGEPSLDVINTKAFQRLRSIRQLSFCDLFYPGAVHTRFEHSLGVFGHAKQALDRLVHDKRFRDKVSPVQARGFLLAALVHDIGHYPFAHPIEHYASSRLWRHRECKDEANHANRTLSVLESDSELRKAAIAGWGEPAFQFAQFLLSADDEHHRHVLKTLLDGPVDVDKMDYLRRDAHHCGVPFGLGADVDGLLQNLTVVRNGGEIGVFDQGVAAVEGLMILQDQMLSSVYWHPVVRGATCMFHVALAHIVGDNPDRFVGLVKRLKQTKSEGDAIATVLVPECEEAAKRISGKRGGTDKVRLTARLLELVHLAESSDFSLLYRPIAEHPRTERRKDDLVGTIYHSLVKDVTHTGDAAGDVDSDVPVEWPNVKRLRVTYLDLLRERGIDVEEMDVVIDVPYGKGKRNMVYALVRSTGDEEQITTISNLPNTIFTQPAAFTSPVRIYASPRIAQELRNRRLEEIPVLAERRFFERPVKEHDTQEKPVTS